MKYVLNILMALCLTLVSYAGGLSDKKAGTTAADPDEFPVPNNVPGLLFYIQRDPNTNTICYQLNVDKQGKISEKNPVNTFWIRYPEGGIRKELNYLQRKFAYGINSKSIGNASYELRSVAYSKLPLYLRRDTRNEYHVYTSIDKKECILSRVFIRIDGGTFWSPNVLYIELKGTEIATGKTIIQRIKPS
ncbi:MAG: DUF4833 domain-containing protein [Dyadobacter sp. 50-39]|uniref:DUF4833 domain-containing protein n=1 Tax=Dyadobacter sp. 50-39 TaxID=1895756 RepID=UPI00096759CE|nr:DUF4833 domain-containing protein [Dyadobacter sp. 50-39]OJV20101.1 MAG: DUF4833 domain-containing protein [Dyadobacter sp. 50-39]